MNLERSWRALEIKITPLARVVEVFAASLAPPKRYQEAPQWRGSVRSARRQRAASVAMVLGLLPEPTSWPQTGQRST
jgi:hypothetical protein